MEHATRHQKKYTYVNVKIPEFIVQIIDENLKKGKTLEIKGFLTRAHFAQLAVIEKLAELNLLSQQDIDDFKSRKLSARAYGARARVVKDAKKGVHT